MKKGQIVWYMDHFWNKIEKGTLISTENQSGHDEHPTLLVKGEYCTNRILTNWIFDTKNRAKACLKKKVEQDIQIKTKEIKKLERLIKIL